MIESGSVNKSDLKAIIAMKSDRIKNWPKAERPRERLLALGADNLTEAELLAIILRGGQGTFKEGQPGRNQLRFLNEQGRRRDKKGQLGVRPVAFRQERNSP